MVAGLLISLVSTASAQRARSAGELDEGLALGLSLGSTVASWAIVAAAISIENEGLGVVGAVGTMFGPSAGHMYAGKLATRGFIMRGTGIAGVIGGLAIELKECGFFDRNCETSGLGPALAILGVGLYVWGTIDDVVTAPTRARRHNQQLQSMALRPVLTKDTAGLAFGGRF